MLSEHNRTTTFGPENLDIAAYPICQAYSKFAESLASRVHLVMVTVHSHEVTVGFVPGL